MKNKKILFSLIFVLLIILILIFFIVKNFTMKNTEEESDFYEYTPEEEISSAQLQETIITLYFIDSNNNLKKEGKLISSTELIDNPYKKIVELLIEGSRNRQLFITFSRRHPNSRCFHRK